MKTVKKNSIENFHFYRREKLLYIAWACFHSGTLNTKFQVLVVQSIVSLTTSLRRQLVKYMPTKLFCTAKDSHIFPTKNNSVFVIFTFENLTKH